MTAIIDRRNADFRVPRPPDIAGDEVPAEPDAPQTNPYTGHRESIIAEDRAFARPAATDADYIATAREYAASVASDLGFAPGEPVEFEADPTVTVTSEGMRVVSLTQTVNGIEVWSMSPKVWLHEGGEVDRLVGDTVSIPANISAKPTVPAEAAVRAAAVEAARTRTIHTNFGAETLPAVDISADVYERTSFQPRNDQPMTFSSGSFEKDITARLVYLYMGGHVRLVWLVALSRENLTAQYQAFVAADRSDPETPEILYFFDTNTYAIGGMVFRHNPAQGALVQTPFPLPADQYPMPVPPNMPSGFPLAWTEIQNGRLATDGNNCRAINGTTRQTFVVDATNGDGVFAPAENSPEQFVTNIFYFCNYMHDFFMMLGFDEASGNFQKVNRPGHGRGADPVIGQAHPGAVQGTANMSRSADGVSSVMNMGMVVHSGRHTANDADVVFHEYCHGVTIRLVGGMLDGLGLTEDQSRSMGEGWSDFFALTITNFARSEERTVVGDWVIDDPGGIRQRPYTEQYPGAFGDIGKRAGQVSGAGNADLSYRAVHNVGEIWCAALMQLTRNVSGALADRTRGYRVTWQAIVDALKLTPKNPTLLIARDAILRAFEAMRGGTLTEDEFTRVRHAAWTAFARYEMGVDAFCPNASFVGCVGGVALPDDVVV
ncbi:M36 family metallopeptidase [Nocardia sp. 2]|uniref:M36 family metallopeptidase n=1 Tax=Nocardia acididurans TaxID=2802282 RepID=A0ABS1MGM9_9NOCA|nr:M36 family metallopeptidase [Nocardia acididurans]MBL1079827.1 M36 family metallopeptidase [Nocardia acididurans]